MLKFTSANEVTLDAEVFIIPNPTGKVTSHEPMRTRIVNFCNAICKENGKEFDPENDELVQLWFASLDDLKCDNMVRHGFTIKDEDGNYWKGRLKEEDLPKKLFEGCKEGDVINLRYGVLLTKTQQADNEPPASKIVIFNMNLALVQTKYRYSRFGNFEDVLAMV